MKELVIEKYLHLRLLVGYLGEATQYSWWSTSFFQQSSKLFLEPVFARTSRLAQYHGVKEAARGLHDERVGLGHVFHLFRLPEEMERDLHKLMEGEAKVEDYFSKLKDKQEALNALTALADGTGMVYEGPINVGKARDLLTNKILKEMARCYIAAFNQGVRTYPYLLRDREGE